VRSLAEVLPIKIASVERIRGQARIHFLAGERALADYREKHQTVQALGAMFSAGPERLLEAARRYQEERENLHRLLRRARKALMKLEAESLSERAVSAGVVTAIFEEYNADDMAALSEALEDLPGGVYLVGAPAGGGLNWYAVAPGDRRQVDVGAVLEDVLRRFGGRGHGRVDVARGGGVPGDEVEAFRRAFSRAVGEAAGWAQIPG
jgi:alanyl-tRNA synthetase